MRKAKAGIVTASVVVVAGIGFWTNASGTSQATPGTGQSATPPPSDPKAAARDKATKMHDELVAKTPQAAKHPQQAATASCARHVADGQISSFTGGPFSQAQNMVNEGSITNGADVVTVYAGATDDSKQGQVVVWKTPSDPCQAGVKQDGQVTQYLDPNPEGPLTLVSLSTSECVVKTSAGKTIRFDLTTGKFTPQT